MFTFSFYYSILNEATTITFIDFSVRCFSSASKPGFNCVQLFSILMHYGYFSIKGIFFSKMTFLTRDIFMFYLISIDLQIWLQRWQKTLRRKIWKNMWPDRNILNICHYLKIPVDYTEMQKPLFLSTKHIPSWNFFSSL